MASFGRPRVGIHDDLDRLQLLIRSFMMMSRMKNPLHLPNISKLLFTKIQEYEEEEMDRLTIMHQDLNDRHFLIQTHRDL